MKGAPRKLRKSCSLPSCSKTPGECMHCTCDGRCGQHDGGQCGVRREGNGKSCKREGCSRDESCLHSTRATCCHCRNLVSSSNRSTRKRTRVDTDDAASVTVAPVVAPKEDVLEPETEPENKLAPTKDEGNTSPTSCDALMPLSGDLFGDFEICDDLLVVIKRPRLDQLVAHSGKSSMLTPVPATKIEVPLLTTKSLADYEQYASRKATSNLVVIVEGTQFNLHKYPMLLESQLLNTMARESVLTTRSAVPSVQLSSFPGGPAAFEALCIYAYTGELAISTANAAALYCGVQFLNMGLGATSQIRDFVQQVHNSGDLGTLFRLAQDANTLIAKHDSLLAAQQLLLDCVDAIARVLPLTVDAIQSLLALPVDLFLQITQEMLATRGPRELAVDTVRQLCIQAELAQLHRDAQDKDMTQACLGLLQQSLATHVQSLAAEEDDDAVFMKMMGEFEFDPAAPETETTDGSTTGFMAALSAASLEPFAFARRDGVLAEPAFAV